MGGVCNGSLRVGGAMGSSGTCVGKLHLIGICCLLTSCFFGPADYVIVLNNLQCFSSAGRQKGLTFYCFKYIEKPFCLHTDALL